MEEVKERLKAWWDHEILDRPCMAYYTPYLGQKIFKVSDIVEFFLPFCLAEKWDGIEQCLKNFEQMANILYFGGESIPNYVPNYGAGCMAAVFGIEPELVVGDDKYGIMSKTVWYDHRNKITLDEIVPHLESIELNKNNPWYARLLRITEIAAKHADKNYSIAMTDLGGILDILSSFLGPQKIILTMKRNPGLIDTCRAIILEKLLKVYDDLQNIIERYGDGCNSWIQVWCPKRYYPMQSDFCAMLNPKWFKRFVLPDLIAQSEHMDYAAYHLDGPNQIVHLDEILKVPSISAIEWIPGAGKTPKCSDEWIPIYKKIQNAGKNLILDNFEDMTRVSHFYNVLDKKCLYIWMFCIDKFKAEFYLPEFVGGQDGKGNFIKFKKSIKKKLKDQNESN
jgi:5-methyltetrahydrofolate--homocysteine methyltransferase